MDLVLVLSGVSILIVVQFSNSMCFNLSLKRIIDLTWIAPRISSTNYESWLSNIVHLLATENFLRNKYKTWRI